MIHDTVTEQMRQLVIAETPPRHIVFSQDGYTRAKLEEESGHNRFTMGGPDTYMGLPFRIDHFQDELVKVSPEDPPRPKLMNQFIGTPELNHTMTLSYLRDILDHILDIAEPSTEVPVPRIIFPAGFQIAYATRENPVELPL